jgi:hypothetical protein
MVAFARPAGAASSPSRHKEIAMRTLSPAGEQAIRQIAERHGFSRDAVTSMLESIASGGGAMAHFSHPEFGGSGQWMRGGMTMVSDMFNDALKRRIDALCSDLVELVANDPGLVRGGSFQSQSQGRGRESDAGYGHTDVHRRQSGSERGARASLFVPPPAGTLSHWWPADLGTPASTGAQNDVRYAYFAHARRLAIEMNGRVTVYDTLDHRIGGFSQQQSRGGSLSFHSQHGLVDVASLPVVAADATVQKKEPPQTSTQPGSSPGNSSAGDASSVLAAIDKLGDLHAKGMLSDEEFAAKKKELLGRI